MFRFCCAMTKYKIFVLFVFVLPYLCVAYKGLSRKRPLLNQQAITAHPLIDQIALANSWQAPNRVISASYAGNPDTGRVNHANLVVTLLPQRVRRPGIDLAVSESLANARTAAEYVSRALEMRHHNKEPQSSYIKYDVYENEETQDVVDDEVNQIEGPIHARQYPHPDVVTRSSKLYNDYESHRKPDYGHHALLNENGEYNHYRDQDNSYANKYQDHYETYGDGYDDTPYKVVEPPYGSSTADIPKSEIIKHIQTSVMKYMKELEVEGRLPTKTSTVRPHTEVKTYYRFPTSTVAPPNNADAATVYNQIVEKAKEKDANYAQIDYYKPAQAPKSYQSHQQNSASKVKEIFVATTQPTSYRQDGYTVESVTPQIDLTFRSKARPKPIDLSALDVGQSWSHDSSSDHHSSSNSHHGHHGNQYRHSSPKPKLHFNSQTYHDINSMTFSPSSKGVLNSGEELAPGYADSYSYVTPVKFKDGAAASVGSSITVGHDNGPAAVQSEEALKDLQDHYHRPIHIINGIPVTNPYKYNLSQLKEMFGGAKVPTHHHQQQPDQEEETNNWRPSYNPKPSYTNYNQRPMSTSTSSAPSPSSSTPSSLGSGSDLLLKEHRSPSTTIHHNLPYDSYNPKFNNNPEGHGYQEHYKPIISNDWEPSDSSHRPRGSDMHTSSTVYKTKKVKGIIGTGGSGNSNVGITISKTKSHGKRNNSHKNKTKVKVNKKNRSLDTELRPPPPEQ